jgi:hypothetical protein
MPSTPFPIRLSEEDQRIIADLRGRTALTTPAIVRLAIRTLRDHMDATSPKALRQASRTKRRKRA